MEQFRISRNCDFPGVYAIVNTSNNKIYIGSSKNIKKRLENHKTKLAHDKNPIKVMQEDYNKGNKFIAYVITPVRLRERKYSQDSDLRYFEHIAIIKFDSNNPKVGYNSKSDTGHNQIEEERTIFWAKNEFDSFANPMHYGYLQNPEIRRRDRREFINKCLTKEEF